MLIVAFLALVALVLGCFGLGRLLRPLTGLSEEDARPALPLLGLGLLVWLTLVLNVAGGFATWVLVAAVGAGLAMVFAGRAGPCLRIFTDPMIILAVLVVIAPVLLLIFIPPEINANDDGPAYLLFSEKLARLGASGPEPFSERRLYGFGGQFGLIAMIRDVLGVRWLSLYEPGLGLAFVGAWVLLLPNTPASSQLARLIAVFGVAFIWLTLTAKPVANLAPAVLYAAMLFGAVEAWLRIWSQPAGRSGWFRLLALLCALALTLRPTAAPFIALLAATAAVPMTRSRDWTSLTAAVALAGVVLAPALLTSLQASQTLFYPFLGSGVHADGPALDASLAETLRESSRAVWSGVLLALSGLVWLWLAHGGRAPRGGLLLLGLAILATATIAGATGGLALDRYAFPILFAVFAAMASRVELSPNTARRLERLAWPGLVLAGAASVGLIGLTALPAARAAIHDAAPAALHKRWLQPALNPDVAAAYREAQAQVPAGATLLAVHLPHADHLDVRRNPVLTADQAATAGPPPGWPQTPASGTLGPYLSNAGVDYVAISDDLFEKAEGGSTAWERRMRWARLLARAQFAQAVAGARPVAQGPDFSIYAVADLN